VKKFHKIHIEISNVCNLQCSFCPEVIRDKKLMDTALFEKIIAQVAPLTEQVAFHLMGDPLLHPKLEEFTALSHRYGAPIFLVTNGILLREKQTSLLLHPAYRQVNFSLHSFHDNFPDADPTEYLERIFAYTERAFVERPDLYINYRLWNLDDPRGTGSKNRDMLRRIEERFGVTVNPGADARIHKSRRLKNRLYLHLDTEFIWPALDLPILGTKGTCHGLSTHFGILVDGTVVPCCLDKEGGIPLGRVQENSIVDILATPRAQGILKGFRERRLTESLCQRCQYIERFREASV
jgi:MoaA/NifB/PqqE/SkfB family radical SAM enzyme